MNRVVAFVFLLLASLLLLVEGRPSAEYSFNKDLNDIHEDDVNNNPLKEGANRMAKFLFGGRSGLASSPIEASAKKIGLDIDAIVEGFLKPDNIAIHVLQNSVNYFSSTLAWAVLGSIASASGIGERSSSTSYSIGSGYNFNHVGKSLSPEGYNAADFINSFADQYQSDPSNTLSKRHLYSYNVGAGNAKRSKDGVYAIRKILRKVANSST